MKITWVGLCLIAVCAISGGVLGFPGVALAESDLPDATAPEAIPPAPADSSTISAAEMYARTQAVLQYFGVPAEADSSPLFDGMDGVQTQAGLNALLPFFDLQSEFPNYTQIQGTRLDAFQDRESKQLADFSVNLLDASQTPAVTELAAHLNAARSNPPGQALQGLKIMLDPGHMGGDNWDLITGKYVIDKATGRKLSEGIINLQTAMLLRDQLTALGAQVMLTHTSRAPVAASVDYDTYDTKPYALQALREQSEYPWFRALIESAPIGPDLYAAFNNSKDFQTLFAAFKRQDYFIDIDLQARVDALAAFQPDIALAIHYDTSDPPNDPNGVTPPSMGKADGVKTYIPGAFAAVELASRVDRAELTRMLLDSTTWNASVALSKLLVNDLSANLQLKLDDYSPGITKNVAPGVFSRNLYILKKHRATAFSYVECLFYNDPDEFNAIFNGTHPMTIDGVSYPYSDRVAQVARSLGNSIVKFVQTGF